MLIPVEVDKKGLNNIGKRVKHNTIANQKEIRPVASNKNNFIKDSKIILLSNKILESRFW